MASDGLFYNDIREPFITVPPLAVTLAATAKALYTSSQFPVLGGQYFARVGKKRVADLFTRDTKGVGGFPHIESLPKREGAKVVETNISIKNPKILTAKEYTDLFVLPDYSRVRTEKEFEQYRKQLESEGYDGIKIIGNGGDRPGMEYWYDQYITFDKSQDKQQTTPTKGEGIVKELETQRDAEIAQALKPKVDDLTVEDIPWDKIVKHGDRMKLKNEKLRIRKEADILRELTDCVYAT